MNRHLAAVTLAASIVFQSTGPSALASSPQASAKEEAIETLKQRAFDGNARAQVDLGLAYVSGDGVVADDVEAVKWFRKAADQDDAPGERYLAEMYFNGRGVPADKGQAAKWLRLSAEQGDREAEHNLAVLYLQGLGVPQNAAEAMKWMRKAADQGLADGQYGLAAMYANGGSIPPNDTEAAKWYRKAASQGHVNAMNNLALLLATTRDTSLRNPQEAITFATQAVAAVNKPAYLDTLATAYFEAGQREKAIETESKALALDPGNKAYEDALDKYIH